ncbi:MAG TPA: vWA domain-containing protein [Pyrinomonadaceae bacterium]|nr:vWA domain-containing protein [Pyrinomonadaceae bacterium]
MYSSQITRANPTCVVFLLDQSGSMADPFGGDEHTRKADFVARVVNHALHDLVIRCTKTEEVRDYYHVSVIGYGRGVASALSGALSDCLVAPVSEVADHPARIEAGYRRVADGAGGYVEMPVRYPVWVYPHADGGTPMCRALRQVRDVLGRWLAEHPRGFPPTVLHLTDGESGDGDPTALGEEIMSLGTDDGRALLFNCHVSSRRARKVEYPASEAGLPDGFARTLFRISSPLPEPFLAAAQQLGVPAAEGSRGFVFNADPSSVVQFYEIGTSLTGMTPHIWMDA